MHKKKVVLLFSTLCMLIVLAAASGWLLVVNDPQKSDVIVVLAGETDSRPALGLKLLEEGYAPHLILNVPAEARIYQWTQPELARKYVDGLPQASAITVCPIHGQSTRDEAREAASCLADSAGHNVLLVTSDYHTRRALSIFRHEIRDRSFSVAAASDPREFGARWWQEREWAKTTFYECMRFLWWQLVDRWR